MRLGGFALGALRGLLGVGGFVRSSHLEGEAGWGVRGVV